jgi:hypothetical protein
MTGRFPKPSFPQDRRVPRVPRAWGPGIRRTHFSEILFERNSDNGSRMNEALFPYTPMSQRQTGSQNLLFPNKGGCPGSLALGDPGYEGLISPKSYSKETPATDSRAGTRSTPTQSQPSPPLPSRSAGSSTTPTPPASTPVHAPPDSGACI